MDYGQLQQFLGTATHDDDLFQHIVDAPFRDKLAAVKLDLGIVVLLLVNPADNTIDRIALSDTEMAKGAVQMSVKPFHRIRIPLGHDKNIIAAAISTGQPQQTADWQYLFVPVLSAQEARFNQAGAGIGCSMVYPFAARSGGAIIYSYFQDPAVITGEHRAFMRGYTDIVQAVLQANSGVADT